MENTNDFRELAFLYFEGKINRKDEIRLYAFINKNDNNMILFHQWEHEWEVNFSDDSITTNGWKNIQNKITGDSISDVSTKHYKKTKKQLWYFAAAIALICVMIISIKSPTFILKNDSEKYFVFESPIGEISKITLPDGTFVWLNSGSILRCPTSFNNKDRLVTITGEAYFDVMQNNHNRFIVKTDACDIIVKGTQFNITAYANDDFIQATLIKGSIDFCYAKGTEKMQPGEQINLIKKSGKLVKSRVNTEECNAWIKRNIEFDNITLGELLKKLERYYNVTFHLQTDSLANKNLRISVRNGETLNEVISAIKKVLHVNITINDKDVYIH